MVYKSIFLVHSSYTILILIITQLFTYSISIMDTLIIGDSIIKYQQKEFVHGDVHVKPFPGYSIARLQARLDADLVASFSNIILHVGVNDVNNSRSPAIILQEYEGMLAHLQELNSR